MNARSPSKRISPDPAPQSSIRKTRTIDAEFSELDARLARGGAAGPARAPAPSVDALFAALEPMAGKPSPDPSSLAIGAVLDGKYRIERKLGEGAMGVVLAATHLGLDEVVAIKFMRPEIQGMEGTFARFAKEAKIAARIRSEHVAKVLDVGVLEPLGPYIVMEYLEGKSLAELLDIQLRAQRGPMAPEQVVQYMLQACEALAAAHAMGVIHRDVKPDNLFITRHAGIEILKLLDFGISKAALTGHVLGGDMAASTISFVMGTPLYMSPEQLRSSPDVDCRTDVWSLGAVMYELLSGEPPFQGTSIPAICGAILDAPPPELSPIRLPALNAVIRRCLDKDPARRFQTVADLAAALVPLAPANARAYASRSSSILRASAAPPSAGEPSAFAEVPRRVRFQSSALVAAATVLALSALGVANILARRHDTPRAEPVNVDARALANAPLPRVAPALAISPAGSAPEALGSRADHAPNERVAGAIDGNDPTRPRRASGQHRRLRQSSGASAQTPAESSH